MIAASSRKSDSFIVSSYKSTSCELFQFLTSKQLVLWIHIGFDADPNPVYPAYLSSDQDPDPRSQTNTEPDPGQTLLKQKV
jgi:hypothetical protein